MWLLLKKWKDEEQWEAIGFCEETLDARKVMRKHMRQWGNKLDLKAVWLPEGGYMTPDCIRAHDPYWGMEEEKKRGASVCTLVNDAAQDLLDALKERQREESAAANAHVSYGGQVGGAACRLRKALKEARK